MLESDYTRLREILAGEYALHGRSLTPSLAQAWIRHLQPFDIKAIEKAFLAAGSQSGRPPVPAEILRYLPDQFGHLGPEEAWNSVPKSEADAGYVTQEMINAWAAARFSVEYGDMVAARMAFIEAYRRELATAHAEQRPATFFYSDSAQGTHFNRLLKKEQNTIKAAMDRWISPQRALTVLEAICTEQGKPMDGYLAILTPMLPPEQSVKKLADQKSTLNSKTVLQSGSKPFTHSPKPDRPT